MATITSAQTGNWEDGATWVGGVAPVSGVDDVVLALGYVIALNSVFVPNSLSTGLAAAPILNINDGGKLACYSDSVVALTDTAINVNDGGELLLNGSWSGTGRTIHVYDGGLLKFDTEVAYTEISGNTIYCHEGGTVWAVYDNTIAFDAGSAFSCDGYLAIGGTVLSTWDCTGITPDIGATATIDVLDCGLLTLSGCLPAAGSVITVGVGGSMTAGGFTPFGSVTIRGTFLGDVAECPGAFIDVDGGDFECTTSFDLVGTTVILRGGGTITTPLFSNTLGAGGDITKLLDGDVIISAGGYGVQGSGGVWTWTFGEKGRLLLTENAGTGYPLRSIQLTQFHFPRRGGGIFFIDAVGTITSAFIDTNEIRYPNAGPVRIGA